MTGFICASPATPNGVLTRQRDETITLLLVRQTEKREIAAFRSILSSRGTTRSRLSSVGKHRKERLPRWGASCHREARRDLAFIGTANRKKREIAAFRSILSSRGTTRSRLYWNGKQRKERLPCFGASCHREERRDLAFIVTANREKRDCRASLATPGGCFDRIHLRFARNPQRGL